MRCARHLILALGVLACLSSSAADYTEKEILDGIIEEFSEIQGSLNRLMNNAIPTTTTEGSTTDGSSTDGSSTDGSSTDGSSTDGSSTDGSSTDGSSTDGSSTDGSSTDGSSTDGSSTDGSSTDGSSTDGSSTDGSSTDGSSTDGSSTDGSATEDSSTDGSSTDGSATDGSSTDGSSTDSSPEEVVLEERQQFGWHPEAVLQKEVEWQKKKDLEWRHSEQGITGWRRMLWADEDSTEEDELVDMGLCMQNTSNAEDLCSRLINVTKDIQEVADEVSNGNATLFQWMLLQNYSDELAAVVDEAIMDPTFIDNLNDTVLQEKVDELNETINKAEEVVNEKIKDLDNGGDDYDPTLAIVLGTLGGILGVALIGGGGYVFYRKRQKNKAGDHGLGSTRSSELGGHTNTLASKSHE